MEAAARRFFRLAKGVEVAAFKIQKEQSLDALYFLAKNTPVDVAKARSNWRIGVGRPLTGVIRAYFPYPSRHRPPYGGGGSKGESANVNAVVNAGKIRLSTFKGGTIYISNNVPYIGPLDRGHSKQTSAGFVSRAIMNAVRRTTPKIKPIFAKEFSK